MMQDDHWYGQVVVRLEPRCRAQQLEELGVQREVGPDGNPEKTVRDDQGKAEQAVHEQREIGVVEVLGGQLALDLGLIATVVAHIEEEAAEEHGEEGEGVIVAEAMTLEAEPSKFLGREVPQDLAPATDRVDGEEEGQDDTAVEDGHLDEVRENHGFHPAKEIVDDGDAGEDKHGQPEGHIDELLDDQGGTVDRDAGGKGPEELEGDREEGPGADAETPFEVFVDRNDVLSAEERQEEDHDSDHGQGHGDLVLQPKQASDRDDEGRRAEQAIDRAL